LDAHNFEDFNDYMVLSGPGFAADIKAGKETLLTATDSRVVDLFTTDYLTFDFTTDRNGVLMCGALKNVYAIYAGLLDLKAGTVDRSKFLSEVAEEMKALLSCNNAQSQTVDLACGLGDLDLTCALPSRNFEFGQILRNNPKAKPEKTVEGITALGKIKRGEIKIPEKAVKLRELIKISDDWSI